MPGSAFLFVTLAFVLHVQAGESPVVARALALLGEYGVRETPWVVVTDSRQNPQAKGKAGFAIHFRGECIPNNTIYLVHDSGLYREAENGSRLGLILLSAVILHERSHCGGADEATALEIEVDYLSRHVRDARAAAERDLLLQNIASIAREARRRRGAGRGLAGG